MTTSQQQKNRTANLELVEPILDVFSAPFGDRIIVEHLDQLEVGPVQFVNVLLETL